MSTKDTYNIIIAGVGGQGLITLLQVIAQAALDKGYEVRTSELHGLSQRGGSVSVHIRFGREVFSPIIARGQADLVLALEMQEALAGAEFASKKTVFLVNQEQTPTLDENLTEEQLKGSLSRVSNKAAFVPASQICQKELQNSVVAGVFLLGLAVGQKILPLEPASVIKAIHKTMPEKYWELNIRALNLAKDYGG